MQYILDSLITTLELGESAVIGAIVRSSGSAPRTSGARMLVRLDGTLVGTLGGGALEGGCLMRAKELLTDSGSDAFAELYFDLTNASAAAEGMVCGGEVSVLLQKVTPSHIASFMQLRDDFSRGVQSMLVTGLPRDGVGPQMYFLHGSDDCNLLVPLRKEILRKSRRSTFLVSHEEQDYFVEPLIHPGTVYLLGAGHVALATAHLASFTGFEVVVMDDREEFANTKRYPAAKEVVVLDSFNDCLPNLGSGDFVVIVTRGHLHDRDVLAQALRTDAGYIGMIGSTKKRKGVYASLLEDGFTQGDLERVYSPIGLSIGGDTPEEIGLSIVAEMVKVRAGMNE
ncbi:MAG: xanthine dehydrogenase accessory factor [Desulforhopalus sp.]|jgi:xanthine dehydrogenase accessory factor